MSSSNLRSVSLRWTGEDLAFVGTTSQGTEIGVDSAGTAGPSPMQLLLLSLAGCMGIDVKLILDKARVPIETLDVEVIGERAESVPKKFVAIEMVYRIAGPTEEHEARIQRAIDLSRDKYCSVLHTLDSSIDIRIRFERA